MSEMQVITLLGSLAGLGIAALTIWKYVESKISGVQSAVGTKVEATAAHTHLVAAQLAEYKTHVAETYVSKAGMREFRDEVMAGVRDLKGSVSTIHERIDQIILAERGKSP